MRLFGLCLMPNHFHALVQPLERDALSAYLQWVLSRYACDLRAQTGTIGHGHIFQRRFWSAGVQDTLHFLTVLRYIEANPRRAGMVPHAGAWPWSSLALRNTRRGRLLDPLPIELPEDWEAIVNVPQVRVELDALRCPSRRGRPGNSARSHLEIVQ